MALRPGTRLGPYEVLAPLGVGGMGEVYRARDTRLGREVAVKVLPQHVSASSEDRARFKREAKTISSLNHPHICVLYDVGQQGDTDYLVMELIEGETLAQRIARGSLPPDDVLRIGVQVADALDRAHRAGVIHRDLKPSNVMLTKSGAKLMDFGIARGVGGADQTGASDVTATSPTTPLNPDEPITAKGTIVGTFQYMAPEQLEGKRVDARADIWALGCVLYEMATGKRAFEGSTPASLISAIMRDQPREMAKLEPLTPPALERTVLQCLAKDADDRWQTAGDLRRELGWIHAAGSRAGVPTPVVTRRRTRERLKWTLAVVSAAAIAVLLQPKHSPESVIFELSTPSQIHFVDLPRISPNGLTLAFNATDSTEVSSIWVRQMNSLEARRLPGTEGAGRPFWSPDSRYLGFFTASKLMKIDLGGGPPVALCDVAGGGEGTWSKRGIILFDQQSTDSVQMVPAAGGIPTGAAHRSERETGSAWPQFLPDGRHFLYIAYGQDFASGTLKVGSVGSKESKTLGPAASRAEYASKRLLYVSGSTLIARPFDPGALKFTGEPVAVAQDVEADRGGGARFSASSAGTLVFHSGSSPANTRLTWLNRIGRQVGTVGNPGNYDTPVLSPDGRQVAVQLIATWTSSEIWVWDLSRNLGSRLTFPDQNARSPVWSPDGKRVAYSMIRGASFDLFTEAAGAAGRDSLLYSSLESENPTDWSADGRWILYNRRSQANFAVGDVDIYALSLTSPVRAVPVVATQYSERQATLSRDGKWIAYSSGESGEEEVYVQSFLGEGGKWRISTGGGAQPFWRGDGRELYYLAPPRSLMVVAVEPGSPPHFSLPRKMFDAPDKLRYDTRNQYVPTRDGQRFLFAAPAGAGKVGTTTVMLNWPAMLGK